MKIINDSFFSGLKLYKDVFKAGSLISLSNEKHLKLVMKRVGWRIVTLSFLSTKETNRFRLLHNFAVHILKMYKNHGDMYVVKYLKACQLAIQKKIAGTPVSSLRELEPDYNFPRLSKSGLPSCINLQDRASICNGSFKVIRFWLSLFSIYRIIKAPFKPKLNTITDSFGGSQIHLDEFNRWLSSSSKPIINKFFKFESGGLDSTMVLPIMKSSPQGSKSYSRLLVSFNILIKLGLISNIKELVNLFSYDSQKFWKDLISNLTYISNLLSIDVSDCDPYVGKLSFKEEAAGKLRIFAMVDVLTQSLLKPIHDQLFSLFERIPNDCTHDQRKGFQLALDLSLKHGQSFGFDLSSATDRLPVSSQASLLTGLYGNDFGEKWRKLLVDRDYLIPNNNYGVPQGPIRYSVGQPMGALSSWAMLNLVHHMMVQYIALALDKVTYGSWYDQYVVLGDDIVLFDKEVADRYLLLCKHLGVEINLSKSVIATRPVVEFAKRTGFKGVDVSALPFKELLMSNNFFGRLAVTTRLIQNKWGKNLFKLFKLGSLLNNDRGFSLKYPLVAYLTQLYHKGSIRLQDVLSMVTKRDKPLAFFGRNISWMTNELEPVVRKLLQGEVFNKDWIPIKDRSWSASNANIYKLILVHRIIRKWGQLRSIKKDLHRLYLFDSLWSAKSVISRTYEMLLSEGRSLELVNDTDLYPHNLVKPIWLRSYWNSKTFAFAKKVMLKSSPISDVFYPASLRSKIPNISFLSFGMDVDLSMGWDYTKGLLDINLIYIKPFVETPFFWKTKKFLDWDLDKMIDADNRLTSRLSQVNFFFSLEEIQKEKVDNPLKVLDFLQEVLNSSYRRDFDFFSFENQIFSKDAFTVDSPGFKPKFSFGVGPKIKSNIDI